MSMRLYQLARELKLTDDQILSFLREGGDTVKSSISALTADQESRVREHFAKAAKAGAKKAAEPEAKPKRTRAVKAAPAAPAPVIAAIASKAPASEDKPKARPTAVLRRPAAPKAAPAPAEPAPVHSEESPAASYDMDEMSAPAPAAPMDEFTEHAESSLEPEPREPEPMHAHEPVAPPAPPASPASRPSFDPARGPVILVKNFVPPGGYTPTRRPGGRGPAPGGAEELEALQRNLKPVTAELPRGKKKGKPGEGTGPSRGFSRGGGAPRMSKRERRIEKERARGEREEKLRAELEESAKLAMAAGEDIFIPEGITVSGLAERINVKVKDVIARLMARNVMATINQPLRPDLAVQVAGDFGYRAEIVAFEENLHLDTETDKPESLVPRAPVVTVVGHVDHGKSSLLEAIHNVDITRKEKGGITQHLGAYRVDTAKGKPVVFIDTPGHEAFTMMRARGAQVTDVIVLVVAADDGVMPQTIEAISHARAAKVPMIVAINKIDKPEADPQRVKRGLSEQGVLTEDWGGDVPSVLVSAKSKQGIPDLLDLITIISDMRELKANPDRRAAGTVLEARLDRSKGPVATVLVQNGTVRTGDVFIAGSVMGRVRALIAENGDRLEHAGPSTPVEVLGFTEVPQAGDAFQCVEDEAQARQVAAYRAEKDKEKALASTATTVSLDNLFEKIKEGEVKELPVLIKADVQGSVEVVSKTVSDLSSEKVRIVVIHASAGAITETDVLLAAASKAIIVGFNVRPDKKAQDAIKQHNVDVRLYGVIYHIQDELKKAMEGLLSPVEKEVLLGKAEVRARFKIPKAGVVAGCMVTEGLAKRTSKLRVVREGIVIHDGAVGSLKHLKDQVSEVKNGFECGVGVANFNDVQVGDLLEFYTIEQVRATLE